MSLVTVSILVAISIIAIIVLTSSFKLKAFKALFIVSVFLAFTALPASTVISTIKEGFGNTMASIGFLIIFGAMIEATGIGEAAGKILADTGPGLLVPFLIAAIMKTAQGSSTVAIITTASFIVPMLQVLEGFIHPRHWLWGS
jgi:GntP family gluconate:H+ symporter